jgi:colanic acid biosynthesis glycosyl transferase WcaI
MNILFITHYYEPDSGAAANRLTRLAKQFHQRGHTITVLTTMPHYPTGIIPPDYQGKFVVKENRDGITVIQVWLITSQNPSIKHRLISQLSFMLTCTIRGIFVKRPDVIFVENQPIFTGLAGWVISKIKRSPYLANISDFWPEYLVVAGVASETSLTYRIFRALTNLTQRHASAIVTLYPPLLDKVKQRIGEIEHSKVIYNAVDIATFNSNNDEMVFRTKYNLGDTTLITFLGILGSHIDLDTMLKVTQHFNKENNLKFVFVGAGQQKDKLQNALAQPQYSHCTWIDWIDYQDVPSFWTASHITFWALHDNPLDQMRFQAKLFEAMGTGTPMVVAVKGLMHDIINQAKAGITVHPMDSEAMINGITKLLEDGDLYKQLSANGRYYAQEHFNPEHNADEYESILKTIAP